MKRAFGYLILGAVFAAPLVACAVKNGIAVTAAIVGITAVIAGLTFLGVWLTTQED